MMVTNLPFESADFRYQLPDKSTLWVSGNGRPLLDAQGNVTGYIGAVTDISERKQLEDALVTSETRFRTLIDFAPVGIVETDVNGSVILTNSQWHTLSGIADDGHMYSNPSQTIHPDDLVLTQATNQSMVATTSPIDNLEYRFLHPDGKIVWVSDSSRSLLASDGEVTGYIIAMTDITKRKQLEEDLRTNEERLRLITDNIHDVVVLTDENAHAEFINPSIRTILGYEPEKMVGLNTLDYIQPDDRSTLLHELDTAITTGASHFMIETHAHHADGRYINVEIFGKLLRDQHSTYRGGVFIMRDITQRKLMASLLIEQEKLQTALDKGMELNNLKARMMGRIAHEFRTPLAIVQSSMETLTYYYDRLTPAQRTDKEVKVRDQIRRITDMLDEIGLVIKGSFTPAHIHRFETDMSSLCRDIATQLEKTLNQPNRYVLDMPQTALVSVDANVLKKAIQHIMHNAALYSAPSTVVTVRLTPSDDHLEIAVTDTGIGIPPNDIPRIFEPFFRGSNIGEIGGLGIRMALARAAVEAHGGTIGVDSTLGKGTTFTIRLPA
jgi:PAS domain S-box-containing protein